MNESANEETQIAWTAITRHQEVYGSDGEKVGVVDEVLGTGETGIFHGLVVRSHHFGHPVQVLAQDVGEITDRKITLKLDTPAFQELPPYVEEDSFTLGITGMFRKRPNWRREE